MHIKLSQWIFAKFSPVLRLKIRQDLLFNTFYLQVMVELTNSVGFSSTVGLSQTLLDRGLWRWPTRECGPVTSAASSESPMDVSRRFSQGTLTYVKQTNNIMGPYCAAQSFYLESVSCPLSNSIKMAAREKTKTPLSSLKSSQDNLITNLYQTFFSAKFKTTFFCQILRDWKLQSWCYRWQ